MARIVAMTSGGLALPDGFGFEDGGKHYIVERESRDDGTFHRITAQYYTEGPDPVYYTKHSEPFGYAYGPLAEGTTTEDVDGGPATPTTTAPTGISRTVPRTSRLTSPRLRAPSPPSSSASPSPRRR